MLHSKNFIAIPPGATIHEQLEDRGMSQKEFSQRMDMSEKHISHLINGKVELTPAVALKLESVLGLPAKFWSNLEMLYREQEARVKADIDLESDKEIAKKIPYSKMAKLGWVKKTQSIEEKVYNLRAYFEVSKLDLLCVPGIAYRSVGSNETSDYALMAWAQKAKLEARNVDVYPINISKLKENITAIRSLTNKPPDIFCEELRSLLSECGVAIVFLEHIGGSFLHGASFVDGKHIVIGLTVRGKYADKFWFSLFHEIGHILDGHIYNVEGTSNEQEIFADQFAKDTLISPKDYDDFIDEGDMSKGKIVSFAKEINIDPGIVLGRLQKEGLIPFDWYHDLKTQYCIIQ